MRGHHNPIGDIFQNYDKMMVPFLHHGIAKEGYIGAAKYRTDFILPTRESGSIPNWGAYSEGLAKIKNVSTKTFYELYNKKRCGF